MNELISRQAAIDALLGITAMRNTIPLDSAIFNIKKLPSAQPEHIRGHWVNGRCDKCNEHAPFWAMASTYYESNFCPNCGAKMGVTE